MKKLLPLIFLISALIGAASAQSLPNAPIPVPTKTKTSLPNNIYGLGVTGNPNGSPHELLTAMYGRRVDTKGTYAITVFDVVPAVTQVPTTTTDPTTGVTTTTTKAVYTVTTNVSAGVAQLFYQNSAFKVFFTPSAGLSYTGTNTGYSYALGGLIVHDFSPNYAIGIGGRAFRSNVSGVTGYQPTLTIEFILKQ